MYFKGTQIGQAGLGGVITTSLNPVITTILVVLLFKHTIHQKEIVGILMGISGGLILIKIWSVNIYQLFSSGNIYFVFGAVLWAIVTLLTQKAKSDMNVVTFSFWMYSISIVIAYPFAAEYSILSVFSFDWIFWINFLSLSIGSLAFATSIYFLAAMELGSQKASSFTFMVPAAAMIFAMIILGEKLELTTLIGGGMAISAVYLINRK
jgi:drug/metabolite transporter (DMT)-like permease